MVHSLYMYRTRGWRVICVYSKIYPQETKKAISEAENLIAELKEKKRTKISGDKRGIRNDTQRYIKP